MSQHRTPEHRNDATGIAFRPLDESDGLEIIDPIDRHRYSLETPAPVTPTPASTEQFRFPVDGAVEVTTEAIALPSVVNTYVRDDTGEVVLSAEHMTEKSVSSGRYSIELSAPIKLYLNVESAVRVESDIFQTRIHFDQPTDVVVGARSHHEHPAATITTTEEPADMMKAVSAFGSALKTTTVERSYPTLRGHPPEVELGDRLDVPDELEPPETGIQIRIPEELGAVYVVAPLAYYLGATVEPGPDPKIVTEDGFEHPLDTHRGFESEVERVLKQVFFLDCLTRTEGLYQVDLHERRAIEDQVGLDFETLYPKSPAEHLPEYLSIPFERLEPHVPDWKVTTHVAATPTSIETLPFLVEDLAVVRTPKTETGAASDAQSVAVNTFFRRDDFTRSETADSGNVGGEFVQPEDTNSLEQVWVGDETPLGASKATATAYKHRLDRAPTNGDINITVVCNDTEMADEGDFVDEVYGDRDELPFNVRVKRDLTTDQLAALLTEDTDFFHYIGHIEEGGFNCADGLLDAHDLDEVGVDAFLLNACSSYEQGMALIDRGSIGGVVTLSDVLNSGAVRIGCGMARLLNRGFPLRAAMNIARDESFVGGQYIVVGDGGLAITQAESGTPILLHLDRAGPDAFEVEIETYPTSQMGIGTFFTPYISTNDEQYLSSGRLKTFELSKSELEQFLSLEPLPVKIDKRLRWSEDIDLEQV